MSNGNQNSGFGSCPTVRIGNEAGDGYIVINESDYNEDIHELYTAEEVAEPSSREEMICQAIGRMNKEDSEQWLADGRPDLNTLRDEAELQDINSGERDAAWTIFSEGN